MTADVRSWNAVDDAFDEYLDALAHADTARAVGLAQRLVAEGAAPTDVLARLVAPAQAEVGERWACAEWNVAREHAATAVSETVVAVVTATAGVPVTQGHAVLACVEGEWHSLPARLVAETVRLSGWRVTFLGASTPPTHLAAFVNDVGPDAVLLSCSVPTALPRARRMIEATREAGVPVLVGGGGFGTDDLRARRLGADAWAADAAGAVEALRTWRPATGAAPPLRHPGADAHAELVLRRDLVVDAAFAVLGSRVPQLAAYDDEQRARTREDLGHVLDVTGAALLVDDPRIVADFTTWLVAVLSARGVPAAAATAGMQALAEALDEVPLAAELLKQAAA